jgi:hypothetical protein
VAISTGYAGADAPGSHAKEAEFVAKATVAVIAAESAPAALVEGLLRFYGTRVTRFAFARDGRLLPARLLTCRGRAVPSWSKTHEGCAFDPA